MRAICVALALLWICGCGEQPDEFGPYVTKLQITEKYWQTLVDYRQHLKSPDSESKARDLQQVIESYQADLEGFGEFEDKYIRAGHNSLKRALAHSLKKLVQPDFPTYTVSAVKQITVIEEAVIKHLRNLEKRWQDEGRPGEFPLSWPQQD